MSDFSNAMAELLTGDRNSLEAEIRRLILRFGNQAVREAAKKLTAGKVGRPKENDLPAFKGEFEQDARDWLENRDPSKRVSSRALAKQFAKRKPGHDELATFDRVYEKLRKQRKLIFHILAYEISEKEYPVDRYLAAIRAVNSLEPHRVWETIESNALSEIETYLGRGCVIGPETCFAEIEADNRAAPKDGAYLRGLLAMKHEEIATNKPDTAIVAGCATDESAPNKGNYRRTS